MRKTSILIFAFLFSAAAIFMGLQTIAIAATGPVISSTMPNDNDVNVSQTSLIGLYFDTPVVPGSGSFYIWQAGASQAYDEIDVVSDSDKVYCDNTEVMITFHKSIPEDGKTYYVRADAGTFKDESTNENWAGISSSTTFNFTMADNQGPQVVSQNPSHTASGVPTSVKPTLQFDETIILTGNGGCDVINNTTLQEVSCTMSVSGNTLVLTPSVPLAYSTEYYIIFGGGPVSDTAGNPYTGMTQDDDWTFVTEDDPTPTATPTPTPTPSPTPSTPTPTPAYSLADAETRTYT